MKTINLNDTTTSARELVEQVGKGPILLRDGRGHTYVLAEVDDADAEAIALGSSPQLLAMIERSRARAQTEGWLTTEQMREQLGR